MDATCSSDSPVRTVVAVPDQEEHINSHLNINDLPDEIIARFFMFSVNMCDSDHNIQTTLIYKTRLILCSVSHRWRQIAIGTPWLWTHIRINHNPVYPPEPLIQLWIERSSSLPIDIYYPPFFSHDEWKTTQYMIAITKILLSHLKFWKALVISFANDRITDAFSELPFETAGSLEYLHIGVAVRLDQECHDKLWTNIATLPTLRELAFVIPFDQSNNTTSFHTAINVLPWQQLRSVSLWVNMPFNEAYDFFSVANAAETIDFKSDCPLGSPEEPQTRPHIKLPNLQLLRFASNSGMHEILQYLDPPSLKILILFPLTSEEGDHPEVACRHSKEFISRTSASLQLASVAQYDSSDSAYDLVDFFNNSDLLDIPCFHTIFKNYDLLDRARRELTKLIDESCVSPANTTIRSLITEEITQLGHHCLYWDDERAMKMLEESHPFYLLAWAGQSEES